MGELRPGIAEHARMAKALRLSRSTPALHSNGAAPGKVRPLAIPQLAEISRIEFALEA
jgi:hypothetical protein